MRRAFLPKPLDISRSIIRSKVPIKLPIEKSKAISAFDIIECTSGYDL
jgi:hypothetical protein